MRKLYQISLTIILIGVAAGVASAQSFRVQCPPSTITHPVAANNNSEPSYVGPTYTGTSGFPAAPAHVNGAIKCQQISGGDGYATMGDGTQTYLFAFGPLSGLAKIANGQPGTDSPSEFNTIYAGPMLQPGDPATTVGGGGLFTFNGAVGQVPDLDNGGAINGHVDPRQMLDIGVMNGNIPAPLMAIDEDDEYFLTLSNVGMIMRPDLFEQHTVHFHGYPNASAFYDGVPDASVAINVGGSFTYYYLAPEAGTYMWHCHISPPEHLQMGMVGQLYVRPKQNAVVAGADLRTALQAANVASATSGSGVYCNEILCAGQTPLPANGATANASGKLYAYNDGDGSTAYDVEYPIHLHGFDPNFHFVGMTFNPESFADNKDKYFLLNGRSYPDTINPAPLSTQASDGVPRFSQPLPTIINIPAGGKALLRFADLNVTEYHTLASLGIPMHVIAVNARLLRDLDGNNLYYDTNSISLAGGESIDVVLDASNTSQYSVGQKFYLYTPQLDHLSNDAENFGGMMTEINICSSVDPVTKACSI